MHVLDSSILIDYFRGTLPKKHLHLINNSAISILSIAELADKFLQQQINFTQAQEFIEKHIHIHPITSNTATKAAHIKQQRRKKHPAFGLADALILATAQEHKQTLYSKDNDFRGAANILEY